MATPIISFRDFSFQYRAQKRPTLSGIDLDIYPGERVLIAGPSGSGKSTLGSCINGLIPAAYPGEVKGELTVCGVDAPRAGVFALSAHVGTVLQDTDGQFIGLTVGEDIAFALENDCTPQETMRETVARAAGLVGVEKRLGYAPHELSGGQKQRVSLAGVMVDQVQVLLFDEPLANLDPAAGKQAIELIDEIQKKTGTTVIIIEHRLEDALWRGADRIVLMKEGRIEADMHPDALLATDLLGRCGIREPLYLTALRYAGVAPRADMRPARADTLTLREEDKAQVRAWFSSVPARPAEAEKPAVLEVSGLGFGYAPGQRTLHDVGFTLREGEMVSVVGPNGAGKSTLVKLICGFETADEGTMKLCGEDMAGLSIRERAARIGYVMQNPNQMISKTMIYDEVALGVRRRGYTEAQIREKVEDALKICGLYPYRNWPVSALSFGQKKRVTIASVLVMGPQIVILDEPTAGQDFKHYTEIMEFLRGLSQRGVTVVMITHDMHLMLEYTPRALVLAEGTIIADRSAAQALCEPDLVRRAALRETSLFALAVGAGVAEPAEFVSRFIEADREVRAHGG